MLPALADDVPILGGTEVVDEEALGDEILVGPQDGVEPTLADPFRPSMALRSQAS